MNPIERLARTIRAKLPRSKTVLDPGTKPDSSWWLDVESDGHALVVEWKPGRGFGVSSPSEGYGEGPDEVYPDTGMAADRIIELLHTRGRTRSPAEVGLPELRTSLGMSQEGLAEALRIRQAAISKMERRSDMNISTLRRLLRAMGAELEIRAIFSDSVVKITQFADDDTSHGIRSAAGRFKRHLFSRRARVLDIDTHRKILKEERLRILGQLAAGIAHDFNNLLGTILGHARLLSKKLNEPSAQRHVEMIETAALTGARTVKRLQDFVTQRSTYSSGVVDLAEIARDVLEVTKPRWKDEAQSKGLAYEVRLDSSRPAPVTADAAILREALINIVLNAMDAMPSGGILTVTTGTQDTRVYCTVRDSGTGMTEDVRRRLFEPFFTTKGSEGTGLGLSIAKSLIERYRGHLDVDSELGHGSAFTLWLPRTDMLTGTTSIIPLSKVDRRAKILVVDDEPNMLEILADMLTDQGHSVDTRSDGYAAIKRLHEETFDLVMTDLAMPGVSGWEVVNCLKQISPDTPVALVTGWPIDPQEIHEKGVDFLLTKPMTSEDLATLLANSLGRKREP